jgi:hypothetical protein
MPRHRHLDEILSLDPERDHQRILFLSAAYDFPWDMTRSLEFALFRTFAAPSVAALLDRTGEFSRRAQKRYDDTDLIMSQIYEYGYDSERGRAALKRMNGIHKRFEIPNGDFLYVLSTFIFEPVRWMKRFGWREVTDNERLAFYYFWREVGRRMNIRDIPESYDAFERYNREYERANFRHSEASNRVAGATRDMLLSWFLPKFLWPIGRPFVYALMDGPLLEAFGYPEPSAAARGVVEGALRARSRLLRIFPERRGAKFRSGLRHRSYPEGWRIEDLGPPPAG